MMTNPQMMFFMKWILLGHAGSLRRATGDRPPSCASCKSKGVAAERSWEWPRRDSPPLGEASVVYSLEEKL